MSAPLRYDWTEANQRLLTAELARLKALLAGEDPGEAQDQLANARAALEQAGDAAAIDTLAQRFDLSPFERELLLLCAGVEMDARLARLCAEAEAQPQRPWATFGLALGALAEPHWSAITPIRPLRRWRLIEIDETANLTTARLKIDERVLHYLAGINYLDARLQPMLRPVAPPGLMARAHADTVTEILARLQRADGPPPAIELTGDDRPGQEDIAAAVAERLGLQLFLLSASDIPAGRQEQDALAVLWGRETALLGSALLIRCDDGADGRAAPRRPPLGPGLDRRPRALGVGSPGRAPLGQQTGQPGSEAPLAGRAGRRRKADQRRPGRRRRPVPAQRPEHPDHRRRAGPRTGRHRRMPTPPSGAPAAVSTASGSTHWPSASSPPPAGRT